MSENQSDGTPYPIGSSEHDDGPAVMQKPRPGQDLDEEQAEGPSENLEERALGIAWKSAWITVYCSCATAWITMAAMMALNHWAGYIFLAPVLAISYLIAIYGFANIWAPSDSKYSTKDAWLMTAYSLLISWTTVCEMIAIHHWAGYVFLGPVLLFSIITALYGIIEASRLIEEDNRRNQVVWHRRGQRSALLHPDIRNRFKLPLTLAALSTGFGLLGTYVTGRLFWDAWLPDSENVEAGPQFALYVWFVLFVGLGLILPALCVLMTPFLLVIKLYRVLRGPAAWPITDSDPNKPPEIPQIKDPVYPMVVECLIPQYISFAFLLVVAIGGFYSEWYYLALIGACIAAIPSMKISMRHALEIQQLQLCVDWNKECELDEAIDGDIEGLLKEREELKDKYENSVLGVGTMVFFAVSPLLILQRSTAIEEISWGWLYFGAVFLVGHYILYRQWKAELSPKPNAQL